MKKSIKIMMWAARVISILTLIVGIPLYFAYGNPLPFADAGYDFFDNLWRAIFPLMFFGLILGFKYEKLGGYLIVVGVLTRFAISLITKDGLSFHTFIPLIAGVLYLIVGYRNKRPN